VVEAEGGVDISIAHLLGDRVCDTAVCLLYSGDGIDLIFQRRGDSSDGDGVVAGADTGVPEVARLARGSVVVLDAGHEWTVMADTTVLSPHLQSFPLFVSAPHPTYSRTQNLSARCISISCRATVGCVVQGAWGAVLYCDFQEAATMTSGTEGGESKTATKRKNRKKEARQQKKLIKEDAKKRAAASTNPKSLAIVPHGCFKSVPIPWEVVEEAHTVVDTRMTPEVEKAHVKDLYNAIAEHWHHTRWKAWPRVTAFVESLPNSSLVGDIGCGNGKNIPACTSVGMGLGCDLSHELVKICRARGFEVAVADAMTLPYRDEVFDATLSIAVMHHLSSPLRRIRAIAELTRVLKTGGQALIYAWAYEQKNAKSGHKFGSQDVFVPWQTRETTRVTGTESTESNAAADASTTSTPTEVAPVNTTTGGLDGEVLQRYTTCLH
jgi:tRNA (uracil-5-)-methyltransferase TRM9